MHAPNYAVWPSPSACSMFARNILNFAALSLSFMPAHRRNMSFAFV